MESEASGRNGRLEKGSLDCFFEPQSVAVIGSMKESLWGGYALVKNLIKAGYKGKIYPIDHSCIEILGLKVFPSIKNVPEKIDLVLIIHDYQTILTEIMDCGEKGAKAVMVISGDFAESNEEGLILQKRMAEIARHLGIRIIGPNTSGIVNSTNDLICCPYLLGYGKVKPGSITLCAQTSIIGPHAFPYADFHYRVSKICDLGNRCDVDESDILEYLQNDQSTKVISMHLENITNGRRFLEIAKRVTCEKPILILRSDLKKEKAMISISRSPQIMDNQIFDSICRQGGIIQLQKIKDLFEIPKIFAYQPLPKGNKLGIVTHTGMGGALAMDEGVINNLSIAKLSSETVSRLNAIFPRLGETIIDIGPFASVRNDYMSAYPEILEAILSDDNVDCLLHILWANPGVTSHESYTKMYSGLKASCQKPVAIWIYGPSLPNIYNITNCLEDIEFPVFSELEIAVKAISVAYQYAIWKKGKV